MLEGYKTSLSFINSLMWTILSISTGLFFIDSSVEKIEILNFSVDQSLIIFIGPAAIMILMIIRQIVIKNSADIVKSGKSKEKIVELTKAYPLLEFIRWRINTGLESVILAIFQALIDLIPTISVFILISVHSLNSTRAGSIIGFFVSLLVTLLQAWNYKTLKNKVYEPLCGTILSPD